MTVDVAALGSVLVGIGGVVAAIIAGFKNKKDADLGSSAETRLLLQVTSEQLMSALSRIDTVQQGINARDAYIAALRDQIYRGDPPPPVKPPIDF